MYAKFLLYFTNILSSFTNQLFNILARYLLIQGSLVIKLKSLRFTVSIMTSLTVTENLCHSFMDKIISSSLTNRIFNTLTRKRLNQEFLIIKLKSSLIKFYGLNHDLVNSYRIWLILIFVVLTPLSAIFQLYRDDQF